MMDEPENQSSTDTEGEISENEANIENLEHVRETSSVSASDSVPELEELQV